MSKKRLLFIPILIALGLASCRPVLDGDSSTASDSPVDTSSEAPSGDSSSSGQSINPSDSSTPYDPSGSSESITPDPSSSDSSTPPTDVIELTWGNSTELNDVANVIAGNNYLAGVVKLVSSEHYEGLFTISMNDVTVYQYIERNNKLIDYMDINVYEGNVGSTMPSGEPFLKISKNDPYVANHKYASKLVESTILGVELSVFISIAANAPISEMSHDIVNVEVDWSEA